jgi:hypothetical protein
MDSHQSLQILNNINTVSYENSAMFSVALNNYNQSQAKTAEV